jgi:hypothetical protein
MIYGGLKKMKTLHYELATSLLTASLLVVVETLKKDIT